MYMLNIAWKYTKTFMPGVIVAFDALTDLFGNTGALTLEALSASIDANETLYWDHILLC